MQYAYKATKGCAHSKKRYGNIGGNSLEIK